MKTVKARINTVLLGCGITILVLATFMLAAGFVIDEFTHQYDEGYYKEVPNSSQYWASIPVNITALIGIVTSLLNLKNHAPVWLKILSTICYLVSMFLTLAVIIEEVHTASVVQYQRKIECNKNIGKNTVFLYEFDCQKRRREDAVYQILLLLSDMTFVLCLVALMAMFADWILSVQQKHAGNEDAENGHETEPPTYECSIMNSAGQPGHYTRVQQMPGQGRHVPLMHM